MRHLPLVAVLVALALLSAVAPCGAECDCSHDRRESDTQAIARNEHLSYTIQQTTEVSDILWAPPTDHYRHLIFEANIAPTFFLFSRRGINLQELAVGGRSFFPGSQHGPWLVVVVPKVNLRMLHEPSAPVPSPSFMPRLDLYRRLHTTKDEDHDDTPGETVDYLLLRVSHHSNGQIGPYRDSLGRIDRDFGSWSTNFVEVGLSRRMPGLPTLVRWNRERNSRVDGYLSFELHPTPGTLNRDAEATDGYAQARIHYRTSALLWEGRGGYGSHSGYDPNQLWLDVQTEFLLGHIREDFSEGRRVGVRPRLILRFGGPADSAFFVEGYWGQDYYNSHFDRYLRRVGLGFVIWPRPLGSDTMRNSKPA